MEFDQEGRNSCHQYWCAAAADALHAISALTMALRREGHSAFLRWTFDLTEVYLTLQFLPESGIYLIHVKGPAVNSAVAFSSLGGHRRNYSSCACMPACSHTSFSTAAAGKGCLSAGHAMQGRAREGGAACDALVRAPAGRSWRR